jgi:predicted MFS family arabinose efflux permease
MTYVPMYLVTQLDFDLATAGAIAAVPGLIGTFTSLSAGVLADWLHRGTPCTAPMSFVTVRRLFTFIPALNYMFCGLCLAFTEPSAGFVIWLIFQVRADSDVKPSLACIVTRVR